MSERKKITWELERVLLGVGFRKHGKALRRDQAGVTVLVSFQKGFGRQWFINVGFWLHALGEITADRVEKTHLYFRLERLVPQWRETILAAGVLEDTDQPSAYEQLRELLGGGINDVLTTLGTDAGLRSAMKESRLSQGLVRKEAREYLGGVA